jgi:catechol 2,3-dioxygenase-like lactoylglutathione lyase family enzyme
MSTLTATAATGRVVGIACLRIGVRELSRSVRWYTEVLGLELVHVHPGGGNALLRLAAEGPGLFLKRVAAPAATHFGDTDGRTAMFELKVDDLDALRGRLVASGWTDDLPVERSECGRNLTLEDPDGNRVQLWAPPVSA